MQRRRLFALSIGALFTATSLLPTPVLAAEQTAEPALLTVGWWWKDAQSEEQDIQGNKVVIDTPSPFCPTVPGQLGAVPGTCAEQRFPVEIRGGDYDEPHMLSGLGFDLSFVIPGSEVFKFEVTLLEAESGCYDGSDEDDACTPGAPGSDDHVEQTDPINIEGKKVKACLLTQIFGDADGRPYNEVPRYDCAPGAPVAERKEVKAVDKDDSDGIDHIWKFDLTDYAREWAQAFTVSTSIMLVGDEPKEPEDDDTWRVVFAGPRAEKGVRTKLVYEPAEITLPPPPPGTDFGSTGTTGFGSTGTTGFGSTGTTDFGSTDVGGDTGTTPGSDPSPAASPGTALASDELPAVEGMPAYMWLAILAGLIGFTMFRQAVVESATGVRPDGVLAKIHALNAQRRGVDVAAAAAGTPGPLAGIAAIGGTVGHGVSSLVSKLPFRRK